MSMSLLNSLVRSATSGDIVDFRIICSTLGVRVALIELSSDLCILCRNKEGRVEIQINSDLCQEKMSTLAVLALAESILHPEKLYREKVVYDMFFLNDMKSKMHSRTFILATRLVLPEHIIEQLIISSENDFSTVKNPNTDYSFNAKDYVNESIYMPDFLNMIIKESSAKLLLNNVKMSFNLKTKFKN
jgi:hypothetical protein